MEISFGQKCCKGCLPFFFESSDPWIDFDSFSQNTGKMIVLESFCKNRAITFGTDCIQGNLQFYEVFRFWNGGCERRLHDGDFQGAGRGCWMGTVCRCYCCVVSSLGCCVVVLERFWQFLPKYRKDGRVRIILQKQGNYLWHRLHPRELTILWVFFFVTFDAWN